MSYVEKVLQPGQRVIRTARLHWISYVEATFVVAVAFVILAVSPSLSRDGRATGFLIGAIVALYGIVWLFRVWFRRWTTEIAVTDRRIIYKTGFISRETKEMNLHRIETVAIEQSVLGRILDYGTVHVRGTGAGIENVTKIASPLLIRSAISSPAA